MFKLMDKKIIAILTGTYQSFTFFFAISFYMSYFMYLSKTQFLFHNVQ